MIQTNVYIILCVDDDSEDLEMLQEALEEVGPNFTIMKACDGEEALDMLRQMKEINHLPSLIVMDINMPKLDGKQTLVSIQSDDSLARVPVVILSTSNSEMDKLFFSRKKVEFITKPIVYDRIMEIAHRLLSFAKTEKLS